VESSKACPNHILGSDFSGMVAQYYRYHTYFPYRRRVNQGRLAVLGIKSAAKPFWIYLKTRQDVLANGFFPIIPDFAGIMPPDRVC
jgi:hypothetical protein